MFCSLSTRALLQCRARSAIVRSIHDPHLPSDHAPVDLTLSAPCSRRGPRIPPTWVSEHPLFLERLRTAYAGRGWDHMPAFEALATRTEVMQQIALEVAKDATLPGPTHVHHWRRHWICAARAAWGRRDASEVTRCVARIPGDGDLFLRDDGTLQPAVSDAALAELLGQANRAAVSEDLDGDLGMADCEAAKTVARARASRRLASWSPSRRQLLSQVVLDPVGEPAATDEAAERLMLDHWGRVFSNNSATDPEAVAWLLSFVQKWEGDIRLPDYGDFVRMVTRTASSAPGPDGLSYASWAVQPDNLQCLYSCMEALWRGEAPPAWFNAATVIFIPTSASSPSDNVCRAPPGRYRPLTLANASQTLLAKAINGTLEQVAATTVSPPGASRLRMASFGLCLCVFGRCFAVPRCCRLCYPMDLGECMADVPADVEESRPVHVWVYGGWRRLPPTIGCPSVARAIRRSRAHPPCW